VVSSRPSSLDGVLDAARRRLLAAALAPAVLMAIAPASLIAAIAVFAFRWLGVPTTWLISIPGVTAIVAMALAWRRGPSVLDAALAIDRSHRLDDTVATAVSAMSMRGADPVFVSLQRAAAEDAVSRFDARRLAASPSRLLSVTTTLALLSLIVALVTPWPSPRQRPLDAAPAASDLSATAAIEPAPLVSTERPSSIAELSHRVESLAREGDLGAAERALDELERRLDDLDRRSATTTRREAILDDGAVVADSSTEERVTPDAPSRDELLRSAARLGEAAEAVSAQDESLDPPPTAQTSGAPESAPRQPEASISKRRGAPADGTREQAPPLPPPAGPDRNRSPQSPNGSADRSKTDARERQAPSADRSGTDAREPREAPGQRTSSAQGSPVEKQDERGSQRDRDPRGDGAPRDESQRRPATGDSMEKSVEGRSGGDRGDGSERPVAAPSTDAGEPRIGKDGSQGRDGATRSKTEGAPRSAPKGESPGAAESAEKSESQGTGNQDDVVRDGPNDHRNDERVSDAADGAPRRESMRQRLEEFSRRLAERAIDDANAPSSGAASDDAADDQRSPRRSPADPMTSSRSSGLSGRGDASDRMASPDPSDGDGEAMATGAATTVERRRSYDIVAVPPNPNEPGRELAGERPRDPTAPTPTDPRALRRPSPDRAGPRGVASDPAIAPRFRPLLERYYERVSGERKSTPTPMPARDAATSENGTTTAAPRPLSNNAESTTPQGAPSPP